MLKKLRDKKTSKKIWIILIMVILPAFLFWGSGSILRNREKTQLLGRISGKRISSAEYKDALLAVKNQAIIQFGDNFSKIQKYLNLEAQAWERLILLAEVKRRNIKVSDKEVMELIQRYPFFQKNGQFNQEIYLSILNYAFRTPVRIFEEQTRQNLMLSKLYREITDNLTLTDEETKKEYQKNNEQISIYYISSLYSDFTQDIALTPQDIKDYFAKNSFKFKRPISFNLDYVSLGLEDEDEKTIKDKIKNLLLRLNKSRTFSVKKLFGGEKVRDKKEEFIKVADDFNLSVKETGLFTQDDPIPGIGWSPEILNLISNAKIGQFLPPIYMDNYYYIIRIKEIKQPYIPDFETIKDEVKEVFIKEESRKIAKAKIQDCLEELKEIYQTNPRSVDFDKIAQRLGLKSGSSALFKYGSYIKGIGASDNFWIASQGLEEDRFSGIIDMPSGFYIIKLKLRVPIDGEKFKAEKNEFAKELLLRRKREYFTKFLKDLSQQAKSRR